ncbi:hypothetical protein WAI453_007662 [Rhynchosporium graminicola]|uniref:Related to WSC4-Cell wall integrity and stress response component 4 n=1 Tax=Rhynchosporium graminicola TaxID=2792576 RepID=A0A1E1L2U2_9HELO|nr:related to WSC4-Cell wall integrity and stress response component 4 [Rhynchosporium commune]
MAFSVFRSHFTSLAVLLLGLSHDVVAQFDQPYCSTSNTAATARNESIYQSNSLCFEWCNGQKAEQPVKYALAIVQYQGCWCTNFAPADTTTGCDKACPGWAPELCGNTSPSLFGYIKLPAAISGTQGGSAPTSTSTSAPQATVTITPDVVPPPPPTTSSTSSSSSTEAETTTSSRRTTSSTSTSPTWTPTPVTSLQTITGQVRTVTVTPTVPPNAQASNTLPQKSKGGGGGLGTGGAVGLTIGLVALIAMIAAGVFFFLRKRRRDQAAGGADDLSRRGSSAGFGAAAVPSRTMSENSRYVLGTDGRRVVETWEPGESAEVRRSRLIPVDQRLDPFSPVYQRGDNKSRESVNTIRDDHDYSRRMVTPGSGGGILRATNPD